MIKQQPKDSQLKLGVLCAAYEKLEQIWSVSLNCVLPKSFIYCYRQKKKIAQTQTAILKLIYFRSKNY